MSADHIVSDNAAGRLHTHCRQTVEHNKLIYRPRLNHVRISRHLSRCPVWKRCGDGSLYILYDSYIV